MKRIYGVAQTPLARVLASAEVTPQTKRRLEQKKSQLNPFALKQEVDRSLTFWHNESHSRVTVAFGTQRTKGVD
ncbi:MAG: hypothetical protein H0X66_08825 [Verrucomicrobia bacterium]|nr:hypothetical protein [Verrucomicrobiota bacterium]